MLFDLGIVVPCGYQNVRKAFIVAQKNIKLGLELLDEILLKQQRLGFGFCRQKHHRRSIRDHPCYAPRMS